MRHVTKLHDAFEELTLLHKELDIHRERFGRKESNKNTRALVLVGGSTIVAGAGAIDPQPLDIAVAIIAIVAAVLGVLALRPSSGAEVRFDLLEPAIRKAGGYRSLLILYKSKLKAHRGDIKYLEGRSRLVTIGFWILIVGLGFAASNVIYLSTKGGLP